MGENDAELEGRRRHPVCGWVRGSQAPETEVSWSVDRLHAEVIPREISEEDRAWDTLPRPGH